jgi:hypothetical protein
MQIEHNAYLQDRRHGFWDKLWKDKEGRFAVWQMPNIWLIAWAVVTTVSIFLGRGKVSDVFFWVGSGLLVIWSLLEIFKGDCYFRRLLGLIVLAFAVASMLNSL